MLIERGDFIVITQWKMAESIGYTYAKSEKEAYEIADDNLKMDAGAEVYITEYKATVTKKGF